MDNRTFFMLGRICACIAIFCNIGKSNSHSIVDLIICPLGNFELIIFVFGSKLFRWADIDMKFPVHPELETTEFSSFVSCLFFVVGAQEILLHTYIFSNPL